MVHVALLVYHSVLTKCHGPLSKNHQVNLSLAILTNAPVSPMTAVVKSFK